MWIGVVSTGSDPLTVFIFVIGILLAIIGSMTGVIVGFIYRNMRENSRHLNSLMYEMRFMQVRMTSAESHLHKRDRYEAPQFTMAEREGVI